MTSTGGSTDAMVARRQRRGSARRALDRIAKSARLALAVGASVATLGCAEPAVAGGARATPALDLGDAGIATAAQARSDLRESAQLDPAQGAPSAAHELVALRPAPAMAGDTRATPSGAFLGCALDRPPGDCDRCPDRACRQVFRPAPERGSEGVWVPFCDQGNLLEEARIACLCAGGAARACELSAEDTARALWLIRNVFGGVVPPAGTRYRDEYGLRDVVDEQMHEWLASSEGPDLVLRCEQPDRDSAEERYARAAQRVRATGSCAPAGG